MARALDWVEVDHYLHGYEVRVQRELVGARMVATRVHNLLPGEGGAISEQQYHPLPLVDAPLPVAAATTKESQEAFAAHMAERNRQLQQSFLTPTPNGG